MSEKTAGKTRPVETLLIKVFGAITAVICIGIVMWTWLDGAVIRDALIAEFGGTFVALLYIALIFGVICGALAVYSEPEAHLEEEEQK